MANIIKYAFHIALGILLIDAAGFILWALSGQYPVDSFYWGAITKSILTAIFF